MKNRPAAPVLFGISIAIWSYLLPNALDTHLFEAELLAIMPEGITFDGVSEFVSRMRQFDNWRITNLLTPFIAIWCPKWLYACAAGGAGYITLWCVDKLSTPHSTRHNFGRGMLLLWALLLLLPWRNNLLIPVYALNYMFPCAIALSAAYLGITAKGSYCRAAAACIVGALAGMCHEGIGVPAAGGLTAMLLWPQARRKHKALIAVAATMSLVSAAWMSASYLMQRAAMEVSSPAWRTHTGIWLVTNIATVAVIVVLCAGIVSRRLRRRLTRFFDTRPELLFFAGTGIAAMIMSAMIKFSGRIAYWPQLCSIIVLAAFFHPWLQRLSSSKTLTALCVLALIIFTGHTAVYCKKVGDTYKAALAMIDDSADGTVFCQIQVPADIPRTTLSIPARSLFLEPYTYWMLDMTKYPKKIAFIPTELSSAPDPASTDSICSYGGYMYYKPSAPSVSGEPVYATLPFAADTTALYFRRNYTSPSGQRLTWIFPR